LAFFLGFQFLAKNSYFGPFLAVKLATKDKIRNCLKPIIQAHLQSFNSALGEIITNKYFRKLPNNYLINSPFQPLTGSMEVSNHGEIGN